MSLNLLLSPTLILLTITAPAWAIDAPHSLTVSENFHNPLGFHDPTPELSWQLPEGRVRQTAYQVRGTVDGDAWQTDWIESDQSVRVPYPGKELDSRQKLEWQVRFRDGEGNESRWSEPGTCEMGLLGKDDWQAEWIKPSQHKPEANEPVAWLRRDFTIDGDVKQARVYVTARGLFELELNGQRVSNDYFAHGWTSYHNRLDTLTYDVTDRLQQGDNQLQASLGCGWYNGTLTWDRKQGSYGDDAQLLVQLEITHSDGKVTRVVSDGEWQGTWTGPIVESSIYDGERYDARIAVEGWKPVNAEAELGDMLLEPKPFAPVRATEELAANTVKEAEPGRWVFDLGQNMVGWARLQMPAKPGQEITIRFAEMLNPDGTMYTANYRKAKSTDYYTAAEDGQVTWEPHFTFHGFRYVELSGLPDGAQPELDWVTGVVLHSDLPRTGHFDSSHKKLNQLQSNIVWGQRGNFVDIPTDCPQRDERLGWTGDAQVFCPTSMFNYDCHAFWKAWMRSLRDDQLDDGRIPHVLPDILGNGGSPGWMDAATIIPWEVYQRTGDTEILAQNIDMMEKLVGYYRSQSKDGLVQKIEAFGDWLQPYASDNRGDTPAVLLGTAFYAHSAHLLAKSAEVLGEQDLADKYAAEAKQVKTAFAEHYFNDEGRLQDAPETQTAYLLAIAFDLIPKEMQAEAAANVVRLVNEADGHLRTGFLGTPYIVSVLDSQGRPDLAYDLLLQESYPSWFYSINQGATTMWERWNSYSHTDGFGDVGMNSFNHYAYGAIGQWMYERVAGLAPDPEHPGYKHFLIQPLVQGPLDAASAKLETPYGLAASQWEKTGDKVKLTVTVPPNTTATVMLPDGSDPQEVSAGTHEYEVAIAGD